MIRKIFMKIEDVIMKLKKKELIMILKIILVKIMKK